MANPICTVTPMSPRVETPTPPLPSIPIATDLASALAAIAAIRQFLEILRNGGGGGSGFNTKHPPPKQGRWQETQRITEVIRVFNPQDHSQWVDIEQINKLILSDTVTKEMWIWNR